MRRLALLCAIIFLGCSVQAAETDSRVFDYWSNLLADNDFAALLAVFRSGPKEEWPAVHSPDFASSAKELRPSQQADFRKLGEKLARGLEHYERSLKEQPTAQFCDNSKSLLSMRQHLAHNPSYFNLILVDAINRVVYVNLSERLTRAEDPSPCLLTLVEQLGSFRPNLVQVLSMVNAELNKPIMDAVAYRSASDVEQLKMLWSTLEPGTPLMMPRDPLNLVTYQLMTKQDIPVLLNRLVVSDLYIHSLLPALIQYRKAVESYSPAATYQEIKAVLGRETQAPESLGVVPFGVTRAASAVSTLLQDVQSGKTRKQLFFSDMGIRGTDSP